MRKPESQTCQNVFHKGTTGYGNADACLCTFIDQNHDLAGLTMRSVTFKP